MIVQLNVQNKKITQISDPNNESAVSLVIKKTLSFKNNTPTITFCVITENKKKCLITLAVW